jgi:hypothetical protein
VARGWHVRTVNRLPVLLEASRGATRSASAPVVLANAGVENVNAQVDELIEAGVRRRLLAFTELKKNDVDCSRNQHISNRRV